MLKHQSVVLDKFDTLLRPHLMIAYAYYPIQYSLPLCKQQSETNKKWIVIYKSFEKKTIKKPPIGNQKEYFTQSMSSDQQKNLNTQDLDNVVGDEMAVLYYSCNQGHWEAYD